ncbi:MAG TPA: hypothetical protein VM327_08475 [Candidatus Thermoplasmatota archaeon]|nr:hypothetical protein [Candidatus Thermoplasmatota archaeon]
MPSRADMDRPASVTTALLGVVLIAITIPYFGIPFLGVDPVIGQGGGTTYAVTWSESSAGTGATAIGPAGSPQEVNVAVRNQRVSNVTIEVAPCADTAQAPLQQPATLTFTLLFENETAKDGAGKAIEGQATCNSPGPFTFDVADHPDVGSIEAASSDAAIDQAYDGAGNRTGTYTLQFSWSRPPGTAPPLPIPVAQPAFTGTVTLDVESWRATANEQGQEAPR